MNFKTNHSVLAICARFSLLAFAMIVPPTAPAATIWTGPNITWTKSATTPTDTIVEGKVVLTRGGRDVLYNKAAGENSAGTVSPKDTMWAFGSIDNATTLSYKTMESLRNGNLALRIINQPMVVHLVAEDIYFSIKFITWGKGGAGTVSYTRSTPAAAVAPTVSITSPSNGASFSTPASINFTATATVTGGGCNKRRVFCRYNLSGSCHGLTFQCNCNSHHSWIVRSDRRRNCKRGLGHFARR